jgi:hypothetical protein
MASSYAGINMSSDKPVREATLNDRLNKVADALFAQCDRLESVLSRVNGTPQKGDAVGGAPVPIRPVHALAQIVESLEGVSQRLNELTGGVERIA